MCDCFFRLQIFLFQLLCPSDDSTNLVEDRKLKILQKLDYVTDDNDIHISKTKLTCIIFKDSVLTEQYTRSVSVIKTNGLK
jgi:hypothetical protein